MKPLVSFPGLLLTRSFDPRYSFLYSIEWVVVVEQQRIRGEFRGKDVKKIRGRKRQAIKRHTEPRLPSRRWWEEVIKCYIQRKRRKYSIITKSDKRRRMTRIKGWIEIVFRFVIIIIRETRVERRLCSRCLHESLIVLQHKDSNMVTMNHERKEDKTKWLVCLQGNQIYKGVKW